MSHKGSNQIEARNGNITEHKLAHNCVLQKRFYHQTDLILKKAVNK